MSDTLRRVGDILADLHPDVDPAAPVPLPPDLAKIDVPIGEKIDALGASVVDVWKVFTALTYRGGPARSGQIARHVGLSRGHVRRLLHQIAACGVLSLKGKRWYRHYKLQDLCGHADPDTGEWLQGKFTRYTWQPAGDIVDGNRYYRRGTQLLAHIRLALRDKSGTPLPRRRLARWCGCSRSTIDRGLALLVAQGHITRTATRAGLILTVLDTT